MTLLSKPLSDDPHLLAGVEMKPPRPPPGSGPAARPTDPVLDWESYVTNLYDHCYRSVPDHTREAEIRSSVEDLRIYLTSHRGRHSLLPLKPKNDIPLPRNEKLVVANHFKASLPKYFR